MSARVKDTKAMIKGLSPSLIAGDFLFIGMGHGPVPKDLSEAAIATFRETEGLSMIVPLSEARAHGFEPDLPMRCITLQVHSALDGVGLTAAVSRALADAAIPCNVVAAFHHDHVFVPATQVDQALGILKAMT